MLNEKIDSFYTDLDNTLCNTTDFTTKLFPEISGAISSHLGIETNTAEILMQKAINKLGTNEMPSFTEEISKLHPIINLDKLAKKEAAIYEQLAKDILKAHIGTLDLLEDLKTKGIPIIVVTNAQTERAFTRMKLTGILNYVDKIIGVNSILPLPETKIELIELTETKPDLDLEAVMKKSLTQLKNSTMFGDHAEKDMALPYRYGMLGFYATFDKPPAHQLPILKKFSPSNLFYSTEMPNRPKHPDCRQIEIKNSPEEVRKYLHQTNFEISRKDY